MEPSTKKNKLEIFDVPVGKDARTPEAVEASYRESIKAHPFYDNVHSVIDFYESGTLRDGQGRVIGVILRKAMPAYAAAMAAELLIAAAVRSSLRCPMFGGEAPLSGIAGYFDYRGSPVELKSRKTAFTHEHEEAWPAVFPAVDYISEIYRHVMPENWAAQSSAIPDVVRIHGSPYSTLTINSRFRTASHTDAGDFDGGYSCITCLDGQFKGLALTFDDFRINVLLQPRDVLVFDSHHFHSNTELEMLDHLDDWRRLTCVFYYRSALGEPASYAEYRRRLEDARRNGGVKPEVDVVREKPNGVNLNRPSPVHPVTLTPFSVALLAHCLRHCASRAQCVHDVLLSEGGAALAKVLFGEPLCTSDGIPLRGHDEKLKATGNSTVKPPSQTGGFREAALRETSVVEKGRYLSLDCLAQSISTDLLNMWSEARARWLELVDKEWQRMLVVNPKRTDFMWKNQSEMNAAFFDLCEVGKQVMLGLLGKDAALPGEERAFWTIYAVHLNAACVCELRMPPEAVSLRKLNIKLKDFSFGGTRYFRDLPVEEQQRRLERKGRIEEARRRTGPSDAKEKRPSWLTNDSFDYQTEDRPVDYAQYDWAPPAHHAKEVTQHVHAGELLPHHGTVRILVVLPHATEKLELPVPFPVAPASVGTSEEWMRLMSSPAVHRLLGEAPRNASLPDEVRVGNVIVQFAFHKALPEGSFDFVVLQHALSVIDDDVEASAYVATAAARCTGCLFVEETDVQCRQYYALKPPIRQAYDAVAPHFFQSLHRVAYGTAAARTRTKEQLENLIPLVCSARYKFQGSPLNTTLHVVVPPSR